MKRVGNVFDDICSIGTLHRAHCRARIGKAHYRDVKWVNENQREAFEKLRGMLLSGEYEVSPYLTMNINDRGKQRVLMKLPYYPDRIVQWAVMLHIGDMFMRSFVELSCAAIKGRGIHYAKNMVQEWLKDKEGTKYCLKFDIRKYYDSIDHDILKAKLRTKIKDARLLKLLDKIVDSMEGGRGIPIGSLLSQNLANFFLSSLDNRLKHKCKVKYVVRYMDDIVVLGATKEYLRGVFEEIKEHLAELKLELKGDWQIFPVDVRGIDFVGYRMSRDYTLLRKSICKRFKARAVRVREKVSRGRTVGKKDRQSLMAYNGWLKHCNSYRLRQKYLEGVIPSPLNDDKNNCPDNGQNINNKRLEAVK